MERFDILESFLNRVAFGEPQRFRNLTVVPLLGDWKPVTSYLVLEDAMRGKHMQIEEVSKEGTVPELKVTNRGADRVLIVDGEELVGAKQNRIVNASFLIPPKKDVVIPVSCVEQGRWRLSSPSLTTSNVIYTARARRMKHRSTTENLRSTGSFRSDQMEVWGTVSTYLTRSGTASRTNAFADYVRQRSEMLDEYLSYFKRHASQIGFLAMIEDQFLVIDIFSRKEAVERLYPKLIRSYALDAIDRFYIVGQEVPSSTEMLNLTGETRWQLGSLLDDARVESFPSVGEGLDMRFESEKFMGNALLFEDEPIHINAFPI